MGSKTQIAIQLGSPRDVGRRSGGVKPSPLRSGRPVAVEISARWRHSDRFGDLSIRICCKAVSRLGGFPFVCFEF